MDQFAYLINADRSPDTFQGRLTPKFHTLFMTRRTSASWKHIRAVQEQ